MVREHLVDILTVLFGIGTWVCVNGIWVELPLLVQTLPEAWTLPSYMSVVVQLANVGPIAYTLLNSFFPKTVTEKRAIYFSMGLETVSTLLLAFLWKRTAFIFGEDHSVGILSLFFCLALVDCSSRVLFLPFMTKFQPAYLMPFFIGEGLSSFVPSIFSLIQGVGGNPECHLVNVTRNGTEVQEWQAISGKPTFSIEVFFYILFGIMLISMIAFHLLNYKSLVQNALGQPQTPPHELLSSSPISSSRRNVHPDYKSVSPTTSLNSLKELTEGGDQQNETKISDNTDQIATSSNAGNNLTLEMVEPDKLFTYVSKPLFISLLIIQVIICSLSNGVFPSIQSYSCLPYGNVAYHIAVALSSMANPVVCFMAMALPKPTQNSILSVAFLSLGVSAYTFTTAIESPQPPLVGQVSGEALLIISWILLVGLFTYVKISIATILRAEGRRGLFLCGAVTQLGSFVGSLTTFFVVNFTETFESYQACQGGPGPMA